jgi:hypothetical protein
MRVRTRKALAIGIAVVLLLCVVPLGAAFAADNTPPWVGSYFGSVKAGGTTVPASIWIEALDANTARVSIQVPGLPVLSSVSKVSPGEVGGYQMPVDFSGAGANVGAKIVLTEAPGGYQIIGDGSGTAFGYSGSGQVVANQTYKYVAMPSVAAQFAGTIDALLGKPTPPAGFPETGAEEPPPPSPLRPAEIRAPWSLGDMLAADFWLTFISMFFAGLI